MDTPEKLDEKTVKQFTATLRQRVDEFLKQVHEDYQTEFAYIVSKIEPSLSLIDKLAAQRLLVRSVAYELTKRIIQEQLPDELIQPEEENDRIDVQPTSQ